MTIKQISEMAGVSPTAVSFVLNNREGVSEETRKKVWAIIEQMGYVPNINSRRLSQKKSFNIAFINGVNYTMFSDLFASSTVKSAVAKATELGYHVFLLPESEMADYEKARLLLGEGNIDGVVGMHDIPPGVHVALAQRGIPMVAIDAHSRNTPYGKVVVNYESMAKKVCEYLIEQGHRKIAYLGLRYLPDFYLSCLSGYKKAMTESEINIDGNWIIDIDDDGTNIPEATQKAAETILACPDRPTAVFCANDMAAIGLIGGLKKLGCSVPEDMSTISIDDVFMARYFIPSLTTAKVDGGEMGRKAIELLHAMIEKKAETDIVEMPDGELVVRDSVARIG